MLTYKFVTPSLYCGSGINLGHVLKAPGLWPALLAQAAAVHAIRQRLLMSGAGAGAGADVGQVRCQTHI